MIKRVFVFRDSNACIEWTEDIEWFNMCLFSPANSVCSHYSFSTSAVMQGSGRGSRLRISLSFETTSCIFYKPIDRIARINQNHIGTGLSWRNALIQTVLVMKERWRVRLTTSVCVKSACNFTTVWVVVTPITEFNFSKSTRLYFSPSLSVCVSMQERNLIVLKINTSLS